MVKKSLLLLLTLLLLFTSCTGELKDISKSENNVNYYIYPYLKFNLSPDRTYYIASVVEGAKLESVSVPGYLHTDFGAMPIKEFAGFENINDSVNLKEVTLDVNIEKVKEGAFDKAENLKVVKTSGDKEGPKWANLPTLTKDGYHFIGWKAGDDYVFNGMPIDPNNSEAVPVFGEHEYTLYEGKEPTCTESGYKPYGICKVCGHSTYEELKALGHNIVHIEAVAATCTEAGIREHYECTRCHLYFSDENGENIITDIFTSPIGHKLTHIEGKAPTCQTEGVIEHYFCEVCKKTYKDSEALISLDNVVLDKVDHQAVDEWSNNSEVHWKKCKWCSYEFYKAEHDFDSGVITKSATLHTKGEKKFTCNTCAYEKAVDIPEHDHIAGETKVVKPTCFNEGYTLETCSNEDCGEVIKTNIVPALDHEGTEYERLEPTCMNDGHIAHYHCYRCGYDFESKSSKVILSTVKLDKVPHKAGSALYHDEDTHYNLCIYGCETKLNITSHSYNQKVTEAQYKVVDKNCTLADTYYYSCVCTKAGSETFTVGEPLGHNITIHQVATEPTCTEPGYFEYWYCDRCKLYFIDEELTTTDTLQNLTKVATGHDYQWVKTDPIQHWKKCTKCGDIIEDSYGAHIYETHNGITSCTICDFIVTTGEGGFKPIIVDKRPIAHLTYSHDGTVYTFTLIDDKPENAPNTIEWYLDGTLKEETGWSFTFNAPYPMTYKVMCVYSNDYGKGSQTIVVNGG